MFNQFIIELYNGNGSDKKDSSYNGSNSWLQRSDSGSKSKIETI